ncbi:phage baseplate protein [Salmonella enterica]|nr:phage baseplate protein [Salmonella enterica]EDH4007875.1 phage baseplate protein [Salmonella enterica subsp. enterica serovar Kottbus]EDW9123486.1 phage baseplate protein [Salmonella enterica subsp. enterica serovar Braenderup]EEL6457144.1 phage baseplate protein [Salmonella enterica subsp. enterica serovar Kottbus]
MSNAQKLPFLRTLSEMMTSSGNQQAELKGRELPCHVVAVNGQIVTVQFDMLPEGINFPEITIPVATFPYIRYPIQPGDMGVTIAADVSLRDVSGLGTGMATLSYSMSLTPLFFVPLANKDWSKEDPRKIVLYGPDGAILKTEDGSSQVTVAPEEIRQKSKAVYLVAEDIFLNGKIHLNGPIVQDKAQMSSTTASLIGPLNVENDAVINGVSVSGHDHDVADVQSGGSTITSKKPNPG